MTSEKIYLGMGVMGNGDCVFKVGETLQPTSKRASDIRSKYDEIATYITIKEIEIVETDRRIAKRDGRTLEAQIQKAFIKMGCNPIHDDFFKKTLINEEILDIFFSAAINTATALGIKIKVV